MKLPISFFSQKNEKANYLLALLLTDEKAGAVILEEVAGKLKIIGRHEAFFPATIETISQEALIETVDKAISKAEEVLPPRVQTHKTVFGVKENWVEEGQKIRKEYLGKLKKVCDSLDLIPLGFMVIAEAIANLLQQEEGAPLSAILALVGTRSISLSLLRGGKIIETIHGEISHSVPAAVDTMLKHFTVAVLPARIILSDGKDDTVFAQTFISHQWNKSLPFLHMPQVTVLSSDFASRAVTFGAAVQMGFEVLDTYKGGVIPEQEESHLQETAQKPDIENNKEKRASPIAGNNFGFILDQDIALLPPQMVSKAEAETKDTAEEEPEEVSTDPPLTTVGAHEDNGKTKTAKLLAFLPALRFPRLRIPRFFSFGPTRGLFLLLIPLLLIIALAGGVVYFYLYKVHATVVITVKPKMVEQTNTVVFSATSPNDFFKNVIAGKNIQATRDGTVTAGATGTKEVGDKAKGIVTIYNNETDSQALQSGSAIQSSNSLTFLLDKDVTVASASGDVFSGTKPGTAQISVTAKDIGTEYNLPSGTKFSIGGSSTLAAKNDTAFSGGTKKQVTVVSGDDLANLKTDLLKNLKDYGNDELAKNAGSGDTVLPLLLDVSLTKSKFDESAGDEAAKVTLTGTAKYTGIAYSNDDLNQYSKSVIKSRYSQDVSFADNSVKDTVKDVKQKSDTEVSAAVSVQAGLLPKIDSNRVLQIIKGKSLKQAKEDLLSKLPQVAQADVTFSPNIPLLPNIFPKLPNQINVEIKSE